MDFIDNLFAGADGFLEIRSFSKDGKQSRQEFIQPHQVDEVIASPPLNWHIYYGLNPRAKQNGTRDSIELAVALHVDVDLKDNDGSMEKCKDRIRRFKLPPTVVNFTGYGLHGIWKLKVPFDVSTPEAKQRYERIQQALQRFIGADKTHDLPRILRLPGTWNCKNGTPKKAKIVFEDWYRVYDLEEFEQFIPKNTQEDQTTTTPEALDRIPEGQRNNHLASLAGSMRHRGMTADEIYAALKAINEKRCHPPLPEDELRRIAESIERYPPGKSIADMLNTLSSDSEIDEVEAIVRQCAELSRGQDELSRSSTQEKLKAKLAEIRVVKAPGKFIEAAFSLRPTEIQDQISSVLLKEDELWPDLVLISEVLEELIGLLKRFFVLPELAAETIAFWIVHTFVIPFVGPVTPYLAIGSPEKRCGKTTLLDFIEDSCRKGLRSDCATPAATFRIIEMHQPTLLIDEFEKVSTDLHLILNSGYRKGGKVIRCEGDSHEPRTFDTFCPKALAGIKRLPDTLEDRSIQINMRRKVKTETVDRFKRDSLKGEFEVIRQKLSRWVEDNCEELRNLDPDDLDELDDRANDNWRILFAIAYLAGGDWPKILREAALACSGAGAEDSSLRIQLLEDVRLIFDELDTDRLHTEKLVEELMKLEDRPWSELNRGKPISTAGIARFFKPFGIKPRQMKIDGINKNGYERKAFVDSWERYLPPYPSLEGSTPSTTRVDCGFQPEVETLPDREGRVLENRQNPHEQWLVEGVEDEVGGLGAPRQKEWIL